MESKAISAITVGNVTNCQPTNLIPHHYSTRSNAGLGPLEGKQYNSSGEEWDSDSEEEEADLDIDGRRHIATGARLDGVYFCDTDPDDTNTTVVRINRMEEQEAVGALQAYLENSLPAEFFQDGYGNVLPLERFKPHELAELQAKLWTDVPREEAAEEMLLIEDDLQLAKVSLSVGRIAEELAHSPRVFVLHNTTRPGCSNLACPQPQDTTEREIVVLEPLLNFASLTAAEMDYFDADIIVFRRNASYYEQNCFDLDMLPLVRQSPRFCLRCLGSLWNMRVQAWACMDREETMKQLVNAFQETLNFSSSEDTSVTSSSSFEEDRSTGTSGSESSPIHTDNHSPPLLQLDGTRVLRTRHSQAAPAANNGGHCERASGRTLLVTLPLRPSAANQLSLVASSPSKGCSNPNQLPHTTSLNNLAKSVIKMNAGYTVDANGSPQFSGGVNIGSSGRASDPTGSPQPFQNINTDSGDNLGAATLPNSSNEVDMVDVDSMGTLTAFGSPPSLDRPGIPRPLILESVDRGISVTDTEKKPSPISRQASPSKFRAQFPRDCESSGNNKDQATPSQPPKLVVPRISVYDLPPMPLCSCRKPWEGRMVHCSNTECIVGSYHHKCLTANEKRAIQRKSETWTCEICNREAERNLQPQGSSLDFRIPFTKEEIMGRLALPARAEGVHDPYGLASNPPVCYKSAPPVRDDGNEVVEGEVLGDNADEYGYEDDGDYEEGGYGEGGYEEEGYEEEGEYEEEEGYEEEYEYEEGQPGKPDSEC
ncbi:uncharacterized protein EI97DRAFT_500998 [Westerdykella ornata]|uniref:Zinc finger PHD-type domain-containing protein n=1 Tax=Westerdykella ornata TaxID=318751 RepID=A0A6A6JL11_WESOR|nr:uncharacterized protein EI97DRAFT_500998 [Westerdykella ornata]KAF2276793.1 hypothetical protein EI97DRAFT_500998 [Westerdykella ornata]